MLGAGLAPGLLPLDPGLLAPGPWPLASGYWKSAELARSKRIWLTVLEDSTLDKATVDRCDS